MTDDELNAKIDSLNTNGYIDYLLENHFNGHAGFHADRLSSKQVKEKILRLIRIHYQAIQSNLLAALPEPENIQDFPKEWSSRRIEEHPHEAVNLAWKNGMNDCLAKVHAAIENIYNESNT